jgi:hypothetical protein
MFFKQKNGMLKKKNNVFSAIAILLNPLVFHFTLPFKIKSNIFLKPEKFKISAVEISALITYLEKKGRRRDDQSTGGSGIDHVVRGYSGAIF